VGACRSAPTAETDEGLNESAVAERTVSLALEVQRAVVSALERHRDDPEAAAEALRGSTALTPRSAPEPVERADRSPGHRPIPYALHLL